MRGFLSSPETFPIAPIVGSAARNPGTYLEHRRGDDARGAAVLDVRLLRDGGLERLLAAPERVDGGRLAEPDAGAGERRDGPRLAGPAGFARHHGAHAGDGGGLSEHRDAWTGDRALYAAVGNLGLLRGNTDAEQCEEHTGWVRLVERDN